MTTRIDRESRLASAFVALADSLAPGRDLVDRMQVLVEHSTELTSVVEGGIVLAENSGEPDDDLRLVASTGGRVTEVEVMQLSMGSGPCFEAYESGALVEVDDIDGHRARWPEFADLAIARGFRAVFALPLRFRDVTLGSLNLFADRVGPLDVHDAVLAQAMAEVATIGIVQSRLLTTHKTVNEQLTAALHSRVRIEQAKGLLAYRHDISVEQAFDLLRTHARQHGLKLHAVADEVMQRRLDL